MWCHQHLVVQQGNSSQKHALARSERDKRDRYKQGTGGDGQKGTQEHAMAATDSSNKQTEW